MSIPQRVKPECPPDAHKVFREPENKVNAQLAVFINDKDVDNCQLEDLIYVLSLMSKSPLLICSNELYQKILDNKTDEFKPNLLIVDNNKAYIKYLDNSQSSLLDFYDFSDFSADFSKFLITIEQKAFIGINMLSMFILRSIFTVYPWDKLLANDFIKQYINACKLLNEQNILLLNDIRYGKRDYMDAKDTDAYAFLKLERKLFLQYPTED